MAGFGRSNSLSINTGGASTGNSLFGNNATQNQATAQLQPQSSGGLFGGQTQAAQTQPPTGGLFGNLNKPTTAPLSLNNQGASLFGGPLGSNTQAQPQTVAASSGGLSGHQSKPSLFGTSTQQIAAPSLFGNTATQQQPAAPSLFGSTQQAQPQQQNSLFGGLNDRNASMSLGGSTLAGSQLGASHLGASVQPVQISLDSIRGTTRFNDLHPELQTLIQQFDEGLQRKIGFCSQIRETLPRTEIDIATIAPDVAYIETFLSTVEVGLDNDSASIAHLKGTVKKDAEDASLSFRAIENLKLPGQFQYRNNLAGSSAKTPAASALDEDDVTKPVDLMAYFSRRADELTATLDVYQRQIREIEVHLRTMESGTVEKAQQLMGSRSAPRDQRRELVEALKAIEGAILDSAKKVGQVRDEVTQQTMGNVGSTLL